LKSVNHAANAIAVIKDPPLGERRFLAQFPASAEAAGNPMLSTDLFGLLGAEQADKSSLEASLPGWEKDFRQAGKLEAMDIRLHPARLMYYRLGFEALLAGEKPMEVLWSLIHTWSLAVEGLPADERSGWEDLCNQLGLIEKGLENRLNRLDAFLDEVEKILENMALTNGLNEPGDTK
jgi:hypothetical protein